MSFQFAGNGHPGIMAQPKRPRHIDFAQDVRRPILSSGTLISPVSPGESPQLSQPPQALPDREDDAASSFEAHRWKTRRGGRLAAHAAAIDSVRRRQERGPRA